MDFRFHEVMEGVLTKRGERFDRPFRFDFAVDVARAERAAFGVAIGRMAGKVWIDGVANGAAAEGTLELSPLRRRQLRYVFDFEADGQRHRFDGHKTLGIRHPLRAWTTLPGSLYGPDGREIGRAVLRFHLRRDLLDLVMSMRLARGGRRGRGR